MTTPAEAAAKLLQVKMAAELTAKLNRPHPPTCHCLKATAKENLS